MSFNQKKLKILLQLRELTVQYNVLSSEVNKLYL